MSQSARIKSRNTASVFCWAALAVEGFVVERCREPVDCKRFWCQDPEVCSPVDFPSPRWAAVPVSLSLNGTSTTTAPLLNGGICQEETTKTLSVTVCLSVSLSSSFLPHLLPLIDLSPPFPLLAKIFGRMFDHSFPACTLIFFFQHADSVAYHTH